jgi:hypothetical protein
MLYVLSATSTGARRAPAYDGNVIGVYRDAADVILAHDLSQGEGRTVHVIPERVDTFGGAWDALDALAAAGIYPRLDHSQHMLVEALGFEATTADGILTNAPTERPLEG